MHMCADVSFVCNIHISNITGVDHISRMFNSDLSYIFLYYDKQLHVAINIYFDVHMFVLFLVHIHIFRTCLFNIFVDTQKHSTIDIALCNMCYILPCEYTMMKIEHTQQGKDL